jgi:L-ascorbate metabolism protein UlaG (beta-lactamase superfamily)
MELQFFGANCIRVSTKKTRIVIDDNLDELGLKSITKPEDIALRTSKIIPKKHSRFDVDIPGEYEVSGVVIHGIAAQSHLEDSPNTIEVDEMKLAVIGHIAPNLSQEQLEQIGVADISIIPVGGHGFTLDGVEALQVIKQLEPKIIIPTHYADKVMKYEVPQDALSEVIKSMGMEPQETVEKYKPNKASLTDTAKLIVLSRQ